ncbi:MAG: hypothetical protein WHS46_13735 [Desulfosoma sp.]
MEKQPRLSRVLPVGLIMLLCSFMGFSDTFGADYKQCVVLDIQKPSNKVEVDNATRVFLDSGMHFFNTNDNFNVSVTNKCKDPGDLYVTVLVPPESGSNFTRYYHELDDTSGPLPRMALTTNKEKLAEDFPKGSSVLWSFVVTKDLKFQGPLVFEAYLVRDNATIGFDSRTVYLNFDITKH